MKKVRKQYDFIVVGGGISGICTAMAAARHGLSTALVQDRSMLGGNASSEMRVHINGAGRDGGFHNAIESGIILELLMANKKVNPQHSYYVFDNVLWEKVKEEKNIDLYLNTSMKDVVAQDHRVKEIIAYQMNTEIEFTLEGKYFSDNTGDGTLAYLSGADYTIGHEARKTYHESLAPEEANDHVMGSSVLFSMKDMGKPMPFKRPAFAYEYTKEMLGKRKIPELTHGYWWIELDGPIEESENIREELLRYVYGVFDYIKNSGDYPEAENLVIDWISSIAGKRESRRVYGDYVLNQNDVEQSRRFKDAIAYGGWTMDDHSVGGIKSIDPQDKGTIWHPIKDIYTIPYRCIYSRNIDNLFIGGRCFSASHMALSSARVQGTGAIMGQAAGTAAYIACRENITPREVMRYIDELQQTLIKDDCYIPGIVARDDLDLVRKLKPVISASSFIEKGHPENINGDYARRIGDKEYAWISDGLGENGEYIQLQFNGIINVKSMILRFDPNFSNTMIITQSSRKMEKQVPDMPYELVKEYEVTFYRHGTKVKHLKTTDNYQRVNKLFFDQGIKCDCIKLTVLSTYGDPNARVFEMRVYE